MQQYLTIWDLVLTPVYLLVLSYLAKRHRDKKYPVGHPLRKYYMPGLWAKFGGAIFIGLIYAFYYKGGDTFNYFNHARIINSSIDDSFDVWTKLLFRASPDVNPQLYKYTSLMQWYSDPSTYAVAVISALLGLLNGTTYLPIALLFAYICYTGIWAMYKTFAQIYPALHKPLAIAFLFIPSTVVWGSAIFKDTVCMFGLGWMTYCTFRIFVNRDFTLKNFFLLCISFYLVALIKVYILLAFVPALSLWLLMSYSHKIQVVGLRWIVNLLFIGVVVAGFLYFSDRFAKELNRYSLERIAQTAEATRGWISYASGDEGSAYDLGTFEPTIEGMVLKLPAAVVVTLYRPFVWEAKKIVMLLSALEAVLFLSGTLYVIFKLGLLSLIRKIFSDPNLSFFLIFSLIFAFAVGISSYNFGALSRYKIPCLPFFAALLTVAYYKNINKKEKYITKRPLARTKLVEYR